MQTAINIMTIIAFAFYMWMMLDMYRRTWAKPTTKQIFKLVKDRLKDEDDELYLRLDVLLDELRHEGWHR